MMPHLDATDKAFALDSLCDSLRAFVLACASNPSSFHDFEQQLWARLLDVGHAAVADFLRLQGTGDLGAELTLPNGENVRRLAEAHPRPLTCVFGSFTLARTCYGTREG